MRACDFRHVGAGTMGTMRPGLPGRLQSENVAQAAITTDTGQTVSLVVATHKEG